MSCNVTLRYRVLRLARKVALGLMLGAMLVTDDALLARPQSPTTLKFYVNETCTPQVVAMFPQKHAAQSIIIYQQEGIDPNDSGFVNVRALQNAVRAKVPPNYAGPVCLDWEGQAMEYLVHPPNHQIFLRTVDEYVKAIQTAKAVRPNAKFGFFGLPYSPYYGRDQSWHDKAVAMLPIFNQSDCLFPHIYKEYAVGEQYYLSSEDAAFVHDAVHIALEMAGNRPVYVYVWPRFHESNPQVGMELIPETEFKNHIAEVFNVSYNGRRAAGLVWWGGDRYFRWLGQQNYPPTHPDYALSARCREVFEAEIAPNETDDQHFTRIHKNTLRQIASVLTAAE